jgi:A/G-specific adenine glycosylase
MSITSQKVRELGDWLLDCEFPENLVRWYRVHKRDLPWRRAQDDPYAVWISEIMLQQTTVGAVIAYFERWMRELPTVSSVASADLQDVLRLWAGLGYYARARNIKKTAEIVSFSYAGQIPSDLQTLLKLPGVGRYTAGAIASIAFDLRAPIVDGNVKRVFSRIGAIDDDIDSSAAINAIWSLAETSLGGVSPREFNQAIMDLGATVCIPSAPRCHICPVSRLCEGYASGDAVLFPRRAKQTRWEKIVDSAVVIENDGRIALIKRPDAGLWGGLWEIPRRTVEVGETAQNCAKRAALERVGAVVEIGELIGVVNHVVMNRKIELRGYRVLKCRFRDSNKEQTATFSWVSPSDLDKYPLAAPQKKLLAMALTHSGDI